MVMGIFLNYLKWKKYIKMLSIKNLALCTIIHLLQGLIEIIEINAKVLPCRCNSQLWSEADTSAFAFQQ